MFAWLKNEKNNKKLWMMIVGAVAGILLLLFGSGIRVQEKQDEASPYDPSKDETVIYQSYLEREIRELCQSAVGVTNVTVAVTLSGGFESVYATEWHEGEESYVILGSGSSASALYLSRSTPTIAGIGIVCTGGGSQKVRNELIPLLAATFSVSSNRIYVTEAGA